MRFLTGWDYFGHFQPHIWPFSGIEIGCRPKKAEFWTHYSYMCVFYKAKLLRLTAELEEGIKPGAELAKLHHHLTSMLHHLAGDVDELVDDCAQTNA